MNPRIEKITKILLWISIFLILTVGGFFVYRFFFSDDGTTPNETPSGGFFGETGAGTTPPLSGEGSGGEAAPGTPELFRIYQVHDKPVVSAKTFTRNGTPFVRFIEQGSGNVFEANVTLGTKSRISNTSIPRIERAVWSPNGSYVAFSYTEANEIRTAIGSLSASTTGAFSSINFLEKNILEMIFSPDETRLAYGIHNNGISTIRTVQNNGSARQDVGSLPLRGISLFWPETSLMIGTNASQFGGALYRIASGAAQRVYDSNGGYFGSVALSDTEWITAEESGLTYHTQGVTEPIISRGIAEKCTSINSTAITCAVPRTAQTNQTVAQWLAGDISSSDDIYLIAPNNTSVVLADADTMGDRTFDMENLSGTIGEDVGYISFKNKTDQTLWVIGFPSFLIKNEERTSE